MKRNVLGIKIESLTFSEAINKIDLLIVNKKPSQIVTVNPEFIILAHKDPEFNKILNNADLSVPDGFGLILAGKFLNQPFKERVTGVDLTWAVCKLAEDRGYKVFFLGGKTGVALETSQRIKKLHPRLKIAGAYSGSPTDKRVYELIKKSKPDILFVAFGAPKQEKFIAELKNNDIYVPLSVGVGGTFDYIAGIYPYAPLWMRKTGLEWLFRLFTQPFRFNRIITATIRFPWAVLRSKLF
ncbi:MAG: WecB/TagA/CpsF family glycosyl transferase, N-acetylglucosaminyldiphosphoundecaprenol [Candidatus Berkelbacteria bacterium]|nr:WecB/TagA/CpsF family glycosyl transferase, N-acetylglucosaminyldiphosphoundecaprenol [Candidatus Berkelbacteria bacterium]